MNEENAQPTSPVNPTPKPVPPPMINPPATPPSMSAQESNPVEDSKPITNMVSAVEAILRQPQRVVHLLRQNSSGRVTLGLVVLATLCALIYGFVAGTFSGGVQYWAAPLKVALGLLASAFICLPSLYIFSCISGSTARLTEVAGLLAGLLALMTVLLIGFAPVAWVFSQTTNSVAMMGVLHLLFWMIACWFAFGFLFKGFRQISGKPVTGVGVWMLLFLLVMLQMTTALRPLIGESEDLLPQEKRFFLVHWVKCLEK